jgi:hypothetical protein
MPHPNPKREAIPSIALCALMVVCGGCRSWCAGPLGVRPLGGCITQNRLAAAKMHQPSCDAIAVNAGYSETKWTSLDSDCPWDLPVGYETYETIEHEPESLPIGELRQIDFEDVLANDEVIGNQRVASDDRAEVVAEALALALAEAIVEVDSYPLEASDELDELNKPGGPEYVEVEVENLR